MGLLRRNRLVSLQQDPTAYIDPEMVREEVTAARRLYSQRGWPVIDVTRRAIEETAAEIMKLLQRHQAERAKAHG